ncbi:MAG: carboxypeptidase regulatory-like domain-containing protein, partial [Polyangiales bacterium]
GVFAIEGLRPGSYTAVATHQGYAPGESGEVAIRPGGADENMRLVLFRGAEVRGRVLDARDRGLTGIPIELRAAAERLPRMTISADDGSFAFLGVRGEVEIAAVPYDMQPTSRSLSVQGKTRVELDLVLAEELLTLRGRVVDERGIGVPDALVTANATRAGTTIRRNAKTDDDGTFAVPALPEPPYAVQVEHAEYSHVSIEVTETRDDVRVRLVGGTTLLGQVIDDWTYAGLEGVAVSLEGPTSLSTRTDEQGQFAFRQVPAAIYEIQMSHPDFESQRRRIEVERPLYVDRPQELPPVRLIPGGSIEGEVLDAYGEPVPGADVTWQPESWDESVRSDRRGRFVLRGVPAGSVWVRARHPDVGEAAASRPTTVRPQETSPGAYVRLPGRLVDEE